MEIEPGVYLELSNQLYHGHQKSYSKSSLVDFSVYPFNLPFQRANRVRKQTWDLGTAIHTAILEPDLFEGTLAVIPPEKLGKGGAKSTKAYKAWAAEQPESLSIVSEDQRDMVLRIRDNVLVNPAHSEARSYLTGGMPEVSCFWEEQFKGDETDEDTGYHKMESYQYGTSEDEDVHKIVMKCRPDYIPSNKIIVDLKTTALPIDPKSYERHSMNLHYHWSAFLTLRGMSQATKTIHRTYVFVVVEQVPPHEVAVYRATQDFIALGMKEVMFQMQRLAWCDKNNKWPGFPNRVLQLGIPGWAHHQLYLNE